jgi:hypothetical protein
MKTKLSFEQKSDIVLNSVVSLNKTIPQPFVVYEQFLNFGKDDNAWLLVLSNYDETKFYFSVFEWEITGDFIKRISKKQNPFACSLVVIPSNLLNACIYDEGAVVFTLQNNVYMVFNFAGKEVLKTDMYSEVQNHLNFLKEISVMHEYGIC